MRIVFLGPPGAGKGTQAGRVARRLGIPHVATGDILRSEVALGTDLGRKASGYMAKGELVPDDVMVAMIRTRVQKEDCRSGFLLDGFPRTVSQAKALDEALGTNRVQTVVHFEIEDEVVVRRLTGRRVCSQCQAPYHLRARPPAVEGVCDACGGEIVQREDDDEDLVRNRLRVYREQTAPVIEHYRGAGSLVTVEAGRDIESVEKFVMAAVEQAEGQE
jgi:adenylate kinase